MAVGFHQFPQHIAFVALSVIFFSAALHGLHITAQLIAARADLSDARTRTAVVVAHERALAAEYGTDHPFWKDVDERLAEDLEEFQDPPKWWAASGLVALNVFMRLAWDLLVAIVALVLSAQP